jgi:hypothetical protein
MWGVKVRSTNRSSSMVKKAVPTPQTMASARRESKMEGQVFRLIMIISSAA